MKVSKVLITEHWLVNSWTVNSCRLCSQSQVVCLVCVICVDVEFYNFMLSWGQKWEINLYFWFPSRLLYRGYCTIILLCLETVCTYVTDAWNVNHMWWCDVWCVMPDFRYFRRHSANFHLQNWICLIWMNTSRLRKLDLHSWPTNVSCCCCCCCCHCWVFIS